MPARGLLARDARQPRGPGCVQLQQDFPRDAQDKAVLGNHQPFVVENGSAVYVPFDHDIAGAEGLETTDGYRRYVRVAKQRLREFPRLVGPGVQLCGVDRYVRTRGCFCYWPDGLIFN